MVRPISHWSYCPELNFSSLPTHFAPPKPYISRQFVGISSLHSVLLHLTTCVYLVATTTLLLPAFLFWNLLYFQKGTKRPTFKIFSPLHSDWTSRSNLVLLFVPHPSLSHPYLPTFYALYSSILPRYLLLLLLYLPTTPPLFLHPPLLHSGGESALPAEQHRCRGQRHVPTFC